MPVISIIWKAVVRRPWVWSQPRWHRETWTMMTTRAKRSNMETRARLLLPSLLRCANLYAMLYAMLNDMLCYIICYVMLYYMLYYMLLCYIIYICYAIWYVMLCYIICYVMLYCCYALLTIPYYFPQFLQLWNGIITLMPPKLCKGMKAAQHLESSILASPWQHSVHIHSL